MKMCILYLRPITPIQLNMNLLVGEPSRLYGRVNNRVRAGQRLVGAMTCCQN